MTAPRILDIHLVLRNGTMACGAKHPRQGAGDRYNTTCPDCLATLPHEPRHRQPAACDVTRTVDFWRALQDQNTLSRLGSRVMLRQAREPDLHPTEAP